MKDGFDLWDTFLPKEPTVKGRMLPFVGLKPWQVAYIEHLYPLDFDDCVAEYRQKGAMPASYRRLIHETDWDSPDAKTWERVWRVEK